MATLQKLIVCLCLTFGIASGVFATSPDFSGSHGARERYTVPEGRHDNSMLIPGHFIPEIFLQDEAVQPDVNDDIARFRRDITYRHPKASASVLFLNCPASPDLSARKPVHAAGFREYSLYSSKVVPDYYGFLFRLTPF